MNRYTIMKHGIDVFGNAHQFRKWLCSITFHSHPVTVYERGWEFIEYNLNCLEYGIIS